MLLKRLLTSDDAATAVEYAVMLALVVVTVIGAIAALGTANGGLWGDIDSDLKATEFGK
jgi:pilus assembly protein Flp/PilA